MAFIYAFLKTNSGWSNEEFNEEVTTSNMAADKAVGIEKRHD